MSKRSHLSHLVPGLSVAFREHFAFADAHCAQAVPHLVVWIAFAALDVACIVSNLEVVMCWM